MDNKGEITRRSFGKELLAAVASITLLETIYSGCTGGAKPSIAETNRIVAPQVTPILNHWSDSLTELCQDLSTSRLSQTLWQEKIDELFGRIELDELLRYIDFARLKDKVELPDLGVGTRQVSFPEIVGVPPKTTFIPKIFGLKKGRAIIPHGHSNMVSAHFVLDGRFSLRHYDKVEQEKDYLLVRKTVEKTIVPGNYSSISDLKDNVHWFIAESDAAFTFDVIVTDLNDRKYDIHNLDMNTGERLSNGLIRVKTLDVDTALKRYGKLLHE